MESLLKADKASLWSNTDLYLPIRPGVAVLPCLNIRVLSSRVLVNLELTEKKVY